jgi:hypothetical protein
MSLALICVWFCDPRKSGAGPLPKTCPVNLSLYSA